MPKARVTILCNEPVGTIEPNLYGHFAEHLGTCIYDGLWVGEDSPIPNVGGLRKDIIDALREVNPPVIRWPGGCFADDYHWEDGIGPREARPRRINLHWGQVVETNAFGTHEFIAFCRAVGAEPYICGNVGSGSPQELRNWVEYCNYSGDSTLARRRRDNGHPEPFKVRYWGVGNENWGCGGHMTPEEYAGHYARFATYLHDFGGTPLFLIACGPSGNDRSWTERFFTRLLGGPRPRIHGFAAHYYCGTAGTATEYSVEQFYELIHKALFMERLVTDQRQIMDRFDPERKIALIVDEWGTWHPPSLPAPGRNPSLLWQQNTLRDALVAASTLDIFNRHCDKVKMANIAQLVNVLQALVLTLEEKMILTPTYYVYRMYKDHQGAQSLRIEIETPEIEFLIGEQTRTLPGLMGSASLKGGALFLTLVNPHCEEPVEAEILLQGGLEVVSASGEQLTHLDIHAHNTFDAPYNLRPETIQPPLRGKTFVYTFPQASVTALKLQVQ